MKQSSLFKSESGHDPGGKVRIPITRDIHTHVVWGGTQEYRYALELIWERGL